MVPLEYAKAYRWNPSFRSANSFGYPSEPLGYSHLGAQLFEKTKDLEFSVR